MSTWLALQTHAALCVCLCFVFVVCLCVYVLSSRGASCVGARPIYVCAVSTPLRRVDTVLQIRLR